MEHDEAQDSDSLFGSPPPSPRLTTTGRPVSPALALPSAGFSLSSGSRPSTSTAPPAAQKQNVGTIALPGSHPDSELPINPLALSLNHGIVHRPPAQLAPAVNQNPNATVGNGNNPWQRNVAGTAATAQARTAAPSASGSSSSTRPAQAQAPAPKPKPKPKKRSRPSSRSSSVSATPQQRGPEFTLPDPSAPPPSHFLRNQENLLGRAGRVAGVKPATLTHIRGSTPSNPILVDGEDDTPRLGLGRWGSQGKGFARPYIDPALLTAPTNQEIVSVLIGQKDIFPILEGVLKLVMGNAATTLGPPPTGFQPSSSQKQKAATTVTHKSARPATPAPVPVPAPPTPAVPPPTTTATSYPLKRRKLNRVPAGASDWDVPYPFPEGQGPEMYGETWERERGKQLIGQLIKLIKVAARKAATKKYLADKEKQDGSGNGGVGEKREKEKEKGARVNGYYKPETATYGLPQAQAQAQESAANQSQVHDVLQDASNASWISDQGQEHAGPSQSQPQPPPPTFEQLIESYVASTEGQGQGKHPSYNSNLTETSSNPLASDADPTGTSTGTDTCASTLDSWMSFFVDNFSSSFDPASMDFSVSGSDAPSPSPIGTGTASASGSGSHCSTPAPGMDEFDFAGMDVDMDMDMGMLGSVGVGGQPGQPEALGAASNSNSNASATDLAAMLSQIFNLPQNQNPTNTMDNHNTGLLPSSSSSIGDHMIDPSLLALSGPVPGGTTPTAASTAASSSSDASVDWTNLMGMGMGIPSTVPNSNSDLSINATGTAQHQAASPIPSTSSLSTGGSGSGSGNGPATPTSAGWDMSLPDVYMDTGSSGRDGGDNGAGGGGGVLDNGEGMWRSTMWNYIPEIEMATASASQGPSSSSSNVALGGWDTQDFGLLPEVFDKDAGQTGTGAGTIDKGKGRALDPPIWMPTPTPLTTSSAPGPTSRPSTASQEALRALIGAHPPDSTFDPLPFQRQPSNPPPPPTPAPAPAPPSPPPRAPSLPLPFSSSLQDQIAASTAAAETARAARKQRKDDIIKRATEKRQRLQKELDGVKMRLWETTVEQAGLVRLARRIDEVEAEAEAGRRGVGEEGS